MSDKKEFVPKDEGHHCDGSGKGSADTFIVRDGHEQIHRDVADACRNLNEPTKGFAGDPTTLKLGNKFHAGQNQTNFKKKLTKTGFIIGIIVGFIFGYNSFKSNPKYRKDMIPTKNNVYMYMPGANRNAPKPILPSLIFAAIGGIVGGAIGSGIAKKKMQ